ncbi:Ubiquitin-associated protein 1 [Anthophora quadrimaculata]
MATLMIRCFNRLSAQCDLIASYMDGIHVKIAEAYKPPRKLCLPAAYNNKLPDLSKLTYDFNLERSVLEKMTEWRNVREANSKAQYTRLNEKRKKEKKEFSPPPPPPLPDTVKPINAPVPETTILTPQPLSPPANDLQDHVKTNGLDFADFDNDTSSPFDNMELKTINDMEELAQVLQPTSQWVPPRKLESILNDLTVNEQSEAHMEEKNDNIKNETTDQEEVSKQENVKHRSVSAIVQELQRDLKRPVMEDRKSWPNLEISDPNSREILQQEDSMVTGQVTLMNILMDLTEDDRKLARHLGDMGFPVSKAARAIRELGGQDNKKIVEYLLAVQSLEEMGISGEDAEKALALTEFNQEKAKVYYENLCTLRDLGFPEEEASAALLKCNMDRDRALDFLIT